MTEGRTPDQLSATDEDAMLRLAMRGARMGTWTRSLIDDSMQWSREVEEMFGVPPDTLAARNEGFLDRVHPEDRQMVTEAAGRAIAERTAYSAEFRFRHEGGEWRWMDARGLATYDEHGRATSLHGVSIDITERKQAELARAHLAAIVESSDDVIVSKTLDGIITS